MNKPLKIIILDGSFKTTTFINRLAEGLSKTQQVYILGFNNKVAKKNPNIKYVDLGSSENLFNLILQSKWLSFKLFFKTGSVFPFFKTIKNIISFNKKQIKQTNFNNSLQLINPDIVHVQWLSLLPWCEEELQKGNYKFVLSQRGYQSNVRPFVRKDNFEYLQKWFPKFAGFHSVSKAILEEGNKIFYSKSKINKVVYSGFDFEALSFQENYNNQEPLQLLSVGRPHWVKGYNEALKACKLLKNNNIKFHYTIIGVENKNEELLYLIADLGLENEITLLPKIEQKKVYENMKESSILLFSSIIEGLPNVVVEAMAIGLPVISTNCGGVEDIIDQQTGWLVPTRKPEALANAIIDFTKLPLEQILSIRESARKKVELQHSKTKMIEDMQSLYHEVITKN